MVRDSGSPDSAPELHTDVLLSEVEKRHILATLHAYDWNKRQAANALGISLKTLYNRLNEWGMGKRPREALQRCKACGSWVKHRGADGHAA